MNGSPKRKQGCGEESLQPCLFGVVPGAGLEPALPQWEQDFKSCVSTNSTTRAPFW